MKEPIADTPHTVPRVCVCSHELQRGLNPKNPILHQFPFPLSLTEDREYKKELTVC